MESATPPRFFFPDQPHTSVQIEAKRVLLVHFHRNLWLGDEFGAFRNTADAKRASSFLLYLVEVVVRSKNVCCFETVYDHVYADVGIKRMAFVRLWIFLETDERADAFNAQAQSMVTPKEKSPTGGRKRSREEEVPVMGYELIASASDVVKALVQTRMSHVDEIMSVTFDHGGAAANLVAELDNVDDDEEDEEVADPDTSLVARLSAQSHFEHQMISLAEGTNRVSEEDSTMSTYLVPGHAGGFVWGVTDSERLARLRFSDNRTPETAWLLSANRLLHFKHPSCVPSSHELTSWLTAQANVVGLSSADMEEMDDSDVRDRVNSLMLSPVMYSPIQEVLSSTSMGASDWSTCRNEEVYPRNAEWMAARVEQTAAVGRAVATGALPETEAKQNVLNIIAELDMYTSEPIASWPPAYANVRRSTVKDMLQFNRALDSSDAFVRETTSGCMFPSADVAAAENMSMPTFFMVQFVELQRCEFGLDRPQAHMNSVIYPWAFILLIPKFGMPGSIQARGPPGSGKGEAKKRLQACVNFCMWFTVDSISEQGTTYRGLPEQCFWEFDENQSQGKASGSTLTQQTTDSNGFSKRARANAETGTTECIAIPCRHVNLGSYNVGLPPALLDREVSIDLPRGTGEIRTAITRGAPFIASCYRILTGLSCWVWLFYMGGLFDFEESVLDMFVGMNKCMMPSSKLAHHARSGESVRILAMALTVFELVSMYFRRERKCLKEDFSYDFLCFIRANAMLSPTAIWQSYLLVTTGEDPRRDMKVLAMFKAHLKRVSGGTYETCPNGTYYLTAFVKLPSGVDSPEMVRAADDSGLGWAIAKQCIEELLKRKSTTSGMPLLRVQEPNGVGGGSNRHRYAVLAEAVADLSVQTPAETAVLEQLSLQVKANNCWISEDETQYVFKEQVRNAILSPTPNDTMYKHGRNDIMAAATMLSNMGLGFEYESGLVKHIAVVHAHPLPTSRVAVAHGPLDPTGTGTVHFGVLPRGQVICIDTDGLHRFEQLRDGHTPEESAAATAQQRLCSAFFLASGANPGHKVFGGVGGADDVCAFTTIGSVTAKMTMDIANPKYTQRAKRLTKSVHDPNESVLFTSTAATVRVTPTLQLCHQINVFNTTRYPDTEGLAYNYVDDDDDDDDAIAEAE